MFETATRMKLRFATVLGLITTEDLWDLPLTSGKANLDDVAKTISKELRETEESFVTKTRADKVLELKLDIVKYVISVKLDEIAEAEDAAELKRKKDLLIDAIDAKETEELIDGKSAKELRKELKKFS